MPMEWIMLLGVLLGAVFALCIFVLRREASEKPWQVKLSEKVERAARFDDDTDRKQPDIPVWRDKPTGIKE